MNGQIKPSDLELTATVFEHVRQAIVITDLDGTILRVNRYFSETTGFAPEEAIGKTPRILKSNRQDRAFYENLWRSLKEKGEWKGKIWNRKKNGEGFPSLLTINSVRDNNGNIRYFVGINEDISHRILAVSGVDHPADTDVLTDLPSWPFFRDRMTRLFGPEKCCNNEKKTCPKQKGPHHTQQMSCHNCRVALLVLQVGDFREITAALGYFAGDVVLQTVSKRIASSIRGIDIAARIGTDEFAVALPDAGNLSEVKRTAERIIASISETSIPIDNSQICVGVSVGISVFPDDGNNINELFKNADAALCRAKADGKNRCRFFDSVTSRLITKRLSMESDLRKAVPRELFVLYQPQMGLQSSRITGVEALVRWRHPTQGLVGPDQFIPMAEEIGVIGKLGEWVLETACRKIARWLHEKDLWIRMGVNVSAKQLIDASFPDVVTGMIEKYRIPPSMLELELTESVVMSHVDTAIDVFGRLKKAGVNVVIDDFGTGYSSLSYLKRLPINGLKIDRSFITNIPDDKEAKIIVRTIIKMAGALNLKVIAEGVETTGQIDFLMDECCDEFQGYLLSKPISAEDLEDFFDQLSKKLTLPPGNRRDSEALEIQVLPREKEERWTEVI